MDGDIRPRFPRTRPELDQTGEHWGYSAVIPAALVEPAETHVVAEARPLPRAPEALKRDDKKPDAATAGDPAAKDTPPAKPPMPGWKKALYWLIGLCILAALIVGGVLYWLHARHFETTDDAFIDGNISQVSAQVGGRVIRLAIEDNQEVTAGQILLQIDPRDYQVRLDQARAQRAQAEAQLDQARPAC